MDPTEEPSGDDDALLESDRYQGVHDLFRYAREQGFDEDPPARIDAILMAAARQHAPEKKGALERFRKWMVATLMQPAVAGAVAVAVIGGSAGILYLRGKGKVAEPTVTAEQHAGAPPAVPMPEPERHDFTLEAPGKETESAMTGSAELGRLRELDETQRELGQATTERAKPKGSPGGGGGTRGDGDDMIVPFGGEGNDPLEFKQEGRDSTKVVITDSGGGGVGSGSVAATTGAGGSNTGGSGTGGRTGGMVGGVKTQIASPDEQPPPPDGTGATDDYRDKEQEEVTPETTTVRTTKPPPSKRSQAENLLRQARTAAKNKDCPTVRTMAKRAKQLDAAYYRDTFVRDAALKDCL